MSDTVTETSDDSAKRLVAFLRSDPEGGEFARELIMVRIVRPLIEALAQTLPFPDFYEQDPVPTIDRERFLETASDVIRRVMARPMWNWIEKEVWALAAQERWAAILERGGCDGSRAHMVELIMFATGGVTLSIAVYLLSPATVAAGGSITEGVSLLEQARDRAGEGEGGTENPLLAAAIEALHGASVNVYEQFWTGCDHALPGEGDRPASELAQLEGNDLKRRIATGWQEALSNFGADLVEHSPRPLWRKIASARQEAGRRVFSSLSSPFMSRGDVKRQADHPQCEINETVPAEEQHMDAALDAAAVMATAERVLQKHQRQLDVLKLRLLGGHTWPEVASLVGKTKSVVEEDYNKAIRKVRRAMK